MAAEETSETKPSAWRRVWNSDLAYDFRRSPTALIGALVALIIAFGAIFAPWLAPQDPYDLAAFDLFDAFTPPSWNADGDPRFLLGTDDQGRDMFSAILYGSRLSITVGMIAVAIAAFFGVLLGLVAGYAGGWVDALIMRVADVQLSFPAILVALLIDGIARAALPRDLHDELAVPVLIAAIALAGWVNYARTVRGSTMVEMSRDYVAAARLIGVSPARIMLRHVLPNVLGPVLVIATVHLAIAIVTEATLSFLGVGVPPTEPSLGTLIRVGNDFLFSGEWWMTIFPGVALVLLVLSVNLLGDWLRDALNPRLK